MNSTIRKVIGLSLMVFVLVACGKGGMKGNIGLMGNYRSPEIEAEWIRNGEPVEFEEELWYPQDGFDVLMDSEVFPISEIREVQFFIQKIDVRPYDRLYTKFGRNKFRIFKKRVIYDKDEESF